MDSINFTANYIKDVNIARKYYNNYKPCNVSLVELDSANPNDVKAIYKTSSNWDCSFTIFTHSDMQKASLNKEIRNKLNVFALTKKSANLNKLKSSDIFGVIEVTRGYSDGSKIEVLQTNPKFINDKHNKSSMFKDIGKMLVAHVKNLINNEPIYVYPTKSAIPFYEKQGFVRVPNKEKNNIFWIKPKS